MIDYDIVVKLRTAVASVYWYKDDMVNLIHSTTREWIGYERKLRYNKFELSQQVLQRLWKNEDYSDIMNLANHLLSIKDFSHFDGIEDGDKYKQRALESVQVLREVIDSYQKRKK